jgi:hypothetical protein
MRASALGWICAVTLVAGGGWAADTPSAAEGKRAFTAGVNLLQDPDGAKYEEALLQFRKAYELLGSWKVLGNVGICSLKLERDGEAIDAFEKYLAGGKGEIEKGERAQVERDLVTLKASVAHVHLEFPSPGVTVVDQRDTNRGQRVVNEYAAAAFAAAPKSRGTSTSRQADRRRTRSCSVRPRPRPPRPRRQRPRLHPHRRLPRTRPQPRPKQATTDPCPPRSTCSARPLWRWRSARR